MEKAATQVAVEVIRPFRAIPGPRGDALGFNYALPVDPLDHALDEGIRRLRTRYWAVRYPLRVEFNEENWPGLAAALDAGGLERESRNPLMVCRSETFRAFRRPGVHVRFLEPDPRHSSTRRAVGELDATIAGRASIGSIDGVAELYGVVTEPAFRRRGVAAALCTALMQRHFDDAGSLVFLDAENEGAIRLYEGLGFRTIGARLSYREPD